MKSGVEMAGRKRGFTSDFGVAGMFISYRPDRICAGLYCV